MSRGGKWAMGLAWIFVISAGGCHTGPRVEGIPGQAVKELEKVERRVDEWGTASVSEFMLLEDKGQFAIEYDGKVSDYIDKARTGLQGTSVGRLEQVIDAQFAGQGRVDVDEVIANMRAELIKTIEEVAGALRTAATATGAAPPPLAPGGDTQDVVPNAVKSILKQDTGGGDDDDGDTEGEGAGEEDETQTTPPFTIQPKLPMANPAAAVLSSEKFSEGLKADNLPSSISERKALLTGINDKIVETLMKTLVNPKHVADPNLQYYMAIMQVNVNPGWRTAEGYIADVNVDLEYSGDLCVKWKDDHKVEDAKPISKDGCCPTGYQEEKGVLSFSVDRKQPMVLSILPLLEAQTLDLRSSERFQATVLGYLSGLLISQGAAGQAEALVSAAERFESDAATRSPIPLVVSYSSGTNFGFRFIPSFQALSNPANARAGSGNVLHAYSFPALVVVQMQKDEIEHWEDIAAHISNRWIPIRSEHSNWQWITRNEFGVRDRVANAVALSKGLDLLGQVPSGNDYVHDELRRNQRMLEAMGIGMTRFTAIPRRQPQKPTPAPKITNIAPSVGFIDTDTTIVITGENFFNQGKSHVVGVTVGGRLCNATAVSDKTIVAVVPSWPTGESSTAQHVVVATTTGADSSPSTITFSLKSPKNTTPSISVGRDGSGSITQIVISGEGSVTGSSLLQQLDDILKGDRVGNDCKVELNLSAEKK